jgi:hypothetical protein
MFGTTLSTHWNWNRLFSYGEVVCFVSAWAVGLLIAMQGQRSSDERPVLRAFASSADTLGIQANFRP